LCCVAAIPLKSLTSGNYRVVCAVYPYNPHALFGARLGEGAPSLGSNMAPKLTRSDPISPADELQALAHEVRRLSPLWRDPETYFVRRDDLAGRLHALSRWLSMQPALLPRPLPMPARVVPPRPVLRISHQRRHHEHRRGRDDSRNCCEARQHLSRNGGEP
jgi:hypothetical protein